MQNSNVKYVKPTGLRPPFASPLQAESAKPGITSHLPLPVAPAEFSQQKSATTKDPGPGCSEGSERLGVLGTRAQLLFGVEFGDTEARNMKLACFFLLHAHFSVPIRGEGGQRHKTQHGPVVLRGVSGCL